jgi:hypothetical protein
LLPELLLELALEEDEAAAGADEEDAGAEAAGEEAELESEEVAALVSLFAAAGFALE